MKEMIKELRKITGAGALDCQKALKAANGDMEKAKEILAAKLGEKALIKVGRLTTEGTIGMYLHVTKKMGSMVTLKCETDFVAKNELFITLANDIAMQISATNPSDESDLLAQPFIKDGSMTIQEMIHQASGKIGENIVIGDFKRFEL